MEGRARNLPAAAARLWLAFARRLGEFNTRVLLGLAYLLVLTPAALLRRLFDRDPLGLAREPEAATYFRPADRAFAPADLEKPW